MPNTFPGKSGFEPGVEPGTRRAILDLSRRIDSSSVTDPLLLSDGTALAPTYSFASDPDTGVYRPAANQLGFAAGGVELLRVGSADVDVMTGHLNLISNTGAQTMSLGEWSSGFDYAAVETPSMVVLMGNASDVNSQGFMRTKGTGSLNLGTNNSNDLTIANGGAVSTVGDLTVGGDVITSDGSAAAPSHTFTGDTDTGMYRDAANSISITTGGVQRLDIDAGGIKGKVVFAAPYGSAAAPGFSFDGDTDTGMYRAGDNTIAFSCGNATRLTIASDGEITGTGVQTTGSAPGASVLLKSHTNGYTYTGWINTVSGSNTATPSRIYTNSGGSDSFVRYMTLANFRTSVADQTVFCNPSDRELNSTATRTANTTYNHTFNSTVGGVAMAGAKAVIVSLAVRSTAAAYFIAWQYGQSVPPTSQINLVANVIGNAQITLPIDSSRRCHFRFVTGAGNLVIMDVFAVIF
jgi:hypothetical protein